MEIVRAGDRDSFIAPDGSSVRELLGPPSGSASNHSLAEATVEPGGETAEHYHRRSEEIYAFLAGSGRMRLGGEEADVSAGDRVAIPAGTPHKLWNTSAGEPLILLCCCAPPYSDGDTVLCEEPRPPRGSS